MLAPPPPPGMPRLAISPDTKSTTTTTEGGTTSPTSPSKHPAAPTPLPGPAGPLLSQPPEGPPPISVLLGGCWWRWPPRSRGEGGSQHTASLLGLRQVRAGRVWAGGCCVPSPEGFRAGPRDQPESRVPLRWLGEWERSRRGAPPSRHPAQTPPAWVGLAGEAVASPCLSFPTGWQRRCCRGCGDQPAWVQRGGQCAWLCRRGVPSSRCHGIPWHWGPRSGWGPWSGAGARTACRAPGALGGRRLGSLR